jgi:hypothetical protein
MTGTAYGYPYVVANSANAAIKIVQDYLNKRDLGFTSDRALSKIELLASEGDYPACGYQVFIEEVKK